MKPLKKIGLVLGSGGARGWAHIGALLELKKLGLQPDYIAGTSIGSIAGAFYATNTVDLAGDLALTLNWKDVASLFFEINFLKSGLVSGKNFIKLLKDIIPARSFSELAYPMSIVATDLKTEKEIIFREGDLFNAIRASIAIPGIFTPVQYESTILVDGGLKNPLPVSACREMGADYIIAIDINLKNPKERSKKAINLQPEKTSQSNLHALERLKLSISKLLPQLQSPVSETFEHWFKTQNKTNEPLSILDVLTRSFRLFENEITRNTLMLNPPDILIQPAVGNIMTLEFYRGQEAIAAGREAVQEKKHELEELLKEVNNQTDQTGQTDQQ
ncbi:MAG: patatin-like phospholipase family protein [Kiritimatiellae bacterium]|jgi:NTE family protein|nr:patatin-like phospholipase family protein [Kiritimatiellia bacterium]